MLPCSNGKSFAARPRIPLDVVVLLVLDEEAVVVVEALVVDGDCHDCYDRVLVAQRIEELALLLLRRGVLSLSQLCFSMQMSCTLSEETGLRNMVIVAKSASCTHGAEELGRGSRRGGEEDDGHRVLRGFTPVFFCVRTPRAARAVERSSESPALWSALGPNPWPGPRNRCVRRFPHE